METVPLNELTIPCPEGFHVMDEEERRGLRFADEGPAVCLSDPGRHMVVCAAAKKIGGLASFLLDDAGLVKNMETGILKAMKPFSCHYGGPVKRTAGGREAKGFCCTYTAQGTAMYGESLLLRSGRTLYYFHLYARQQLKEESLPVWEGLLGGTQGLDRDAGRGTWN